MEVSCDAREGLPDLLDVAAVIDPKDRLLLLGEPWLALDRISARMGRPFSMIRVGA
jgi:hypothetical protein